MKVIAYRCKPNPDGKSQHVEFIKVLRNWKDIMFFEMACEITHYTPMLFKYERGFKKDVMKFYERKLKELYRMAKEE